MPQKRSLLQDRIAELVAQHSSYRGAERATGVDAAYLWKMFAGHKTDPSDEVLKQLGLKRTITYTRIKDVPKS